MLPAMTPGNWLRAAREPRWRALAGAFVTVVLRLRRAVRSARRQSRAPSFRSASSRRLPNSWSSGQLDHDARMSV